MTAAKKISPSTESQQLLENKWEKGVTVIQLDGDTVPPIKNEKIVAVCDQREPQQLLDLVLDHGATQIVQQSNLAIKNEINASALMLNDPDHFIKFPVSSILDPLDAGAKKEKSLMVLDSGFSRANEKSALLDNIKNELDKMTKSMSFVSELLAVADELITNAIFNAPFVDADNGGSGASRNDQLVQMDKGLNGKVFLGRDNERLVIGCQDPYGSLNLTRLFSRVRDCYKTGLADNINMGSGGAGIGSFIVYNTSCSYYAAVKTGAATLICCTIPLMLSARKRAVIPKNLHYFQT